MLNLQNLKLIFIIGIVAVLSVLIHKWNVKYELQDQVQIQNTQLSDLNSNPIEPDFSNQSQNQNQPSQDLNPLSNALNHSLNTEFHTDGKLITVNTDLMTAQINLQGGNLIHTALLNYPVSTTDKTPIDLLNNQANSFYVAQSGLIGEGLPTGSWTYQTSQQVYNLDSKDLNKDLKVNLYFKNNSGLEIIKQYVFHPHSYLISVNYLIKNSTGKPWSGRFYGQLLRVPPAAQNHNLLMSYSTFTGGAYSSSSTRFEKLSFSNMANNNLKESSTGGWVSMVQHYFISAWIPANQNQNTLLYSRVFSNSADNSAIYAVGMANPEITISAGQLASTGANIYVGPTISKDLEAAAPNLNLTIDYGWLWFISELLFWVMAHIQHFVGNWGLSIIAVTVLIKLVFYPLSAKSFRSMGKMRLLQPKMQELKKQYGDDRQAIGRATMELYKKEGVNPLSGCLPILIQIPVFIGLYWMLMASVELRQAPFIFWIKDLSLHDPYFILPVLMGLSMFVQQKLNPKPADPTQAKVMMFLPIIFTALFLGFPAGLVLYWIVNNCVGILQQWFVLSRMAKEKNIIKK